MVKKVPSYNKVDENIVTKLKAIVGEEYVMADNPPMMYSYMSRGIMGLRAGPPDCVVRPINAQEVSQILKLCTENKIPVTPMAGGLSGGFALPLLENGGVLLECSRMNKIIEVNTDARFVIVEPGVRAGEVWAYFKKYYPEWAPPIADGAPPAATIMGDAIERGFSLVTGRFGPQADMVMGMEVVLPTGEILHTGSWGLGGVNEKYQGAKQDGHAKPFYKYGLGPDLHSLFFGSQGAMGVVTRAALKIVPHCHYKTVLAFGFENWADLCDATLMASKYECGISDNMVMVQSGNWWLVPTRFQKEKIPKTYDYWAKLGIPAYFTNFECWAHSQEELDFVTTKLRKIILEDFAKIAKAKVTEQKLHPIQIASRLKKPNKIAIPYGQWEQGFLFITWYVPWAEAAECVELYCSKMEEYKFPPVMWIASIDHCRECIVMPIFCFDSRNIDDFERLEACETDCTKLFLERGWVNYRPDPTIHAPLTYAKAPTEYKILRKIKELIDPAMIMHPGRLAWIKGVEDPLEIPQYILGFRKQEV
ncbi:MAG TPA: FAD-binding oxidoreductase [Candidatus Deferrimicrobium sp.]|nr:FAD-binding oxidoreductase [Candidatus Deferrimicrobium sp.]